MTRCLSFVRAKKPNPIILTNCGIITNPILRILRSAEIVVLHLLTSLSTPNGVTDEQRHSIRFDRVYCVFDKDTHRSYQPALDVIASAAPKETFYAITSVPCFEFWLLLHFAYTTPPFCGTAGGKSAGDRVIDELLKHLPAYTKGGKGIFTQLIDQLPRAIRNSEAVLRTLEQDGTDNPGSLMHELVKYLQGLAKS